MRTTKRSRYRRGWPVVVVCLLTACSGGDQAGEVSTATSDRAAVEVASTSVVSDAGVVAAIEGFDVVEAANVGSRAALTIMILTDPESTRATAKNLVGSDDADVRLAAIYALSITLSSGDVDALSPSLESTDRRERVLAAAGLLAVGDARAVPVLIASLDDDTPMALGFPPVHVWERARVALLQATGEDFGLGEAVTAEAAAATIPDWELWWAGTEDDFHVVAVADPFG